MSDRTPHSHREIPGRLLLVLLVAVVLAVAMRPCLTMVLSAGGADTAAHGHLDEACCGGSDHCPEASCDRLATNGQQLVKQTTPADSFELPLLPLLLTLTLLLYLGGRTRYRLPPNQTSGRPAPPLRFRVLLI